MYSDYTSFLCLPSVPGTGPGHHRCSVAFMKRLCLGIECRWCGDKGDKVWGMKKRDIMGRVEE